MTKKKQSKETDNSYTIMTPGKKEESKRAKWLRSRIARAEADIERLEDVKVISEQKLAEEIAEFKVGNLVWYRSKPAVVTHVRWKSGEVSYFIKYVRKNGTLYINEIDAWEHYYGDPMTPRDEVIENEEVFVPLEKEEDAEEEE